MKERKDVGAREPRKRANAVRTLENLVTKPGRNWPEHFWVGGKPFTMGRSDVSEYVDSQNWGRGELQQKIDEVYYGLKKAKIVADNQRMDASSSNAQDLRKMRAMTAQTKKNVRVTKRMVRKAENAADAAAASADSAAASAASAAASASSAAASAASAARSAEEARFGF